MRMQKMNSFLIAVAMLALAGSVRAQWVNMTGPYVGNVTCMAAHGTMLIAATEYRGLFYSVDYGLHWRSLDARSEAGSVRWLFVNGSKLYAGYYGGVLTYTYDGMQWIPDAASSITGYTLGYALHGSNLFVATTDPFGGNTGGLFRSADNGTTWQKIYPSSVTAVCSSGEYLVATFGLELHRSTDNGATWTTVPTGIVNLALTFYKVGRKIFVLTGSDSIFVSSDDGATWRPDTTTPFVRGASVIEVPIGSGASQYLAGTAAGLFQTSDSGATWRPMNSDLTNANVHGLARVTNGMQGTLFAATAGPIFSSTNNGANWSPVNSDIARYPILSLAVHGTTLLAGTRGGGAYRSLDDAATWSKLAVGSGSGSVTCFAVSGGTVIAGTEEGGVFLSRDGGSTWNASNAGLTNYQVAALAVSDAGMFAGTYNGGIFRSTNNGASWGLVNSGLSDLYISSLAASGTHLLMGEKFDGVYHSADNGAHWSAANSGLTDTHITSLTANGPNLFAGTRSGLVFRSADFGAAWAAYGSWYAAGAISSILGYGSDLFVGTDVGVYQLQDNGASSVSTDSGRITLAASLAVKGTYLFAAGSNGVWRRPLKEITAVGRSADMLPSGYSLGQNFPNPFNPTTTIAFTVPADGRATLTVFTIIGQKVATLFDGVARAGTHNRVEFDAARLASGVYVSRLEHDGKVLLKTMSHIK